MLCDWDFPTDRPDRQPKVRVKLLIRHIPKGNASIANASKANMGQPFLMFFFFFFLQKRHFKTSFLGQLVSCSVRNRKGEQITCSAQKLQ